MIGAEGAVIGVFSDDMLPEGAVEWRMDVQQALVSARVRLTQPRRLMVAWIASTRGPFSAEMLLAELERQRGGTRATVYRFVDWLRHHGWLERVSSNALRHTYVRRRPGHQHQAVCLGCGSTLTLSGCAVEQVIAPELALAGFEMHGHMLEIYGLCRGCRDTKERR